MKISQDGFTPLRERWNGLLENGKLADYHMNSFNHYAYGSVCEAIYSRIVGLRNAAPGWKKVIIKPHLNYRMKSINFSYQSISGKYEICWRWIDTRFNLNVTIPYGCQAEIILPNGISHNVQGGKYNYECDINRNIYSPFSTAVPIIDLIKNNESIHIIKNLVPKIYNKVNKKNNEIKKHSIITANSFFELKYTPDILKKCNEELSKIKP